MKPSLERDHPALHELGGLIVPKIAVNLAGKIPHLGFDLRLISQVIANAVRSLIQNLFQYCSVTPLGDFGTGSSEHLFKELEDLQVFRPQIGRASCRERV